MASIVSAPHLCKVLSNHFQVTVLYEQLRLTVEMLEGKTCCCLFQRVMAQTDIYGALLQRKMLYFPKCSPKRHIWSATDITKGTCCVQQLMDTHDSLDISRVACAVSALILCPCTLPEPWDFHGLWAANRPSQKGRFHLTRPVGAILSLSQLEVILHILKATFLVVGQAIRVQKLRT